MNRLKILVKLIVKIELQIVKLTEPTVGQSLFIVRVVELRCDRRLWHSFAARAEAQRLGGGTCKFHVFVFCSDYIQ